jgi:TRAP-type mannitol/chloroaromatic compound transport system substrate-binding protein
VIDRIQLFGAGALIPAGEGFDAAGCGIFEMNHANAYCWIGKAFAAPYFTAVPFGLNVQGLNSNGLELWRKAEDRFNLLLFLYGNTGVQTSGWFRRPIEKVDDFRGRKMRILGLAGRQ